VPGLDRFDLTERVAIVTGGAGRLGTPMCYAMAERGAHIVVASRNLENCERVAAECSKIGLRALPHQVDVTNPTLIERMVTTVFQEFGRIDILVNNASGMKLKPFEELSAEDWDFSLRAGLTSVALCSQQAGKYMIAQKNGSIINIGSIYGVVAPDIKNYGPHLEMASPATYGSFKGGLVQLTRYLAGYWGKYGVRTNMISPGGIFANQPKEFVKNYIERVPLGRMGAPEDLSGPLVFLASDASAYVNGANLMVDGGWTAW